MVGVMILSSVSQNCSNLGGIVRAKFCLFFGAIFHFIVCAERKPKLELKTVLVRLPRPKKHSLSIGFLVPPLHASLLPTAHFKQQLGMKATLAREQYISFCVLWSLAK
jgi:hypothetical protein